MNGQNASLLTRQEVIDKITDDGIWFIAKLRHHAAREHSCAAVPFEIDRAMRGFAVYFSPPMWATRTLMFSGDQIKPPKLRIVHDLVP
jgi:hypothetical protein